MIRTAAAAAAAADNQATHHPHPIHHQPCSPPCCPPPSYQGRTATQGTLTASHVTCSAAYNADAALLTCLRRRMQVAGRRPVALTQTASPANRNTAGGRHELVGGRGGLAIERSRAVAGHRLLSFGFGAWFVEWGLGVYLPIRTWSS